MHEEADRRDRLHRLIDFARLYRGWSRAQLAKSLDRDSTKLYPDTGNPKLDLLVALAGVLDWPVSDVAEYIWSGDAKAAPGEASDFEALDAQARDAHGAGQYQRMADLARRMYLVARTAEERARACNREHGAWDGLGRYTKALEAVCRGLGESPISATRHNQLQANLANTHYTLWELAAALAHAHMLVQTYERRPPQTPADRKAHAFIFYVRGHTHRRFVQRQPDRREEHLEAAESDLLLARDLHRGLASEFNDARLLGIARTCEGGLLELDVERGRRSAADGVRGFLDGLEQVVDPGAAAVGDWLESHGWWCIFGANVALRHLSGRPLQQAMAVFTNKALEIADRLDNWALRERVFTMQYQLHETLVSTTGLDLPFTIDDEEKRLITGTMGRFPAFRDTGWKIFRTARLIRDANGN